MINIIDYIQLCSEALLCLIDEDVYDSNNVYLFIDLSNKIVKEKIKFYLKSQLQSKRQYGKFNLVINSCNPIKNWRQKINQEKYILTDESIKLDINLFENLVDNLFLEFKKSINDFIFILDNEIDIIDIITILDRILGVSYLHKNQFFILENGNNYIIHDIHNIPNYIFQNIERQLKENRLNY